MSNLAQRPLPKRSHERVDARSLEMGTLIAAKIRRQPELFEIARANLQRWKQTRKPWPRALQEWEEIIERFDRETGLNLLTEDSEEGRRRRQSDPFCGILTEAERKGILLKYEALGT